MLSVLSLKRSAGERAASVGRRPGGGGVRPRVSVGPACRDAQGPVADAEWDYGQKVVGRFGRLTVI